MILRKIEVAEGGRDTEMGWQALQRITSLSPTATGPASRIRRRLALRRVRRSRSPEESLLRQPFLPQPPLTPVSLSSPEILRMPPPRAAADAAASDDIVHTFEVEGSMHVTNRSIASWRP